MSELTRRAWLAGAGMTALAVGLDSTTAASSKNKQQHPRSQMSPRELLQLAHLPNVPLVTQHGKKVRFYDDLVRNKKVVINVMYTNCEKQCPVVTANLVRVQKLLHDRVGRDIFFYSITLKPEEDTPKVLKRYATMHHTGPGWLFLTGQAQDIETLRRGLGFQWSNPVLDARKSSHLNTIRIGDEAVMRWSAMPGNAAASWIATCILAEMDGSLRATHGKAHTTALQCQLPQGS